MKKTGLIEQERYTCAIGALQSVVAIPRAVPILHSGPGCGDMIKGFFERSTGYAGGDTSPCTNFSEKDVVFGGIDRLREIISIASISGQQHPPVAPKMPLPCFHIVLETTPYKPARRGRCPSSRRPSPTRCS